MNNKVEDDKTPRHERPICIIERLHYNSPSSNEPAKPVTVALKKPASETESNSLSSADGRQQETRSVQSRGGVFDGWQETFRMGIGALILGVISVVGFVGFNLILKVVGVFLKSMGSLIAD